jgi:hypothetical protein
VSELAKKSLSHFLRRGGLAARCADQRHLAAPQTCTKPMRAGGRALAPAAAPFAGGEQPRLRLAAIAAMAPAARLAWSIEEAGAAPPAARPDETLLYAHTLCPYAERFALTMHEIGVEFRLVHVDLARKPGWFRGLGSRGRVPAAAHGGRTRAESLDPCRTTWSSARRRSRRRGRSSTRRVRPVRAPPTRASPRWRAPAAGETPTRAARAPRRPRASQLRSTRPSARPSRATAGRFCSAPRTRRSRTSPSSRPSAASPSRFPPLAAPTCAAPTAAPSAPGSTRFQARTGRKRYPCRANELRAALKGERAGRGS